MSAIAAFAGRDLDRAVVEQEAIAALLSFDTTVRHYRVFEGGISLSPKAAPA